MMLAGVTALAVALGAAAALASKRVLPQPTLPRRLLAWLCLAGLPAVALAVAIVLAGVPAGPILALWAASVLGTCAIRKAIVARRRPLSEGQG